MKTVLTLALPAILFAFWGWAAGPAPAPAAAQTAANSDDGIDWQGLPPGKGREETFYLCGPCHSLKLVTQQGLTRERWDELMDYMVREQAMPPLDPGDRKLIVDYLAEYYGPDRKARGGPSLQGMGPPRMGPPPMMGGPPPMMR